MDFMIKYHDKLLPNQTRTYTKSLFVDLFKSFRHIAHYYFNKFKIQRIFPCCNAPRNIYVENGSFNSVSRLNFDNKNTNKQH